MFSVIVYVISSSVPSFPLYIVAIPLSFVFPVVESLVCCIVYSVSFNGELSKYPIEFITIGVFGSKYTLNLIVLPTFSTNSKLPDTLDSSCISPSALYNNLNDCLVII